MDFTMGQNLKNLKSTFLAENLPISFYSIPKDANGNIGSGGMFSKKSSFCLYFHEKIMIFDF